MNICSYVQAYLGGGQAGGGRKFGRFKPSIYARAMIHRGSLKSYVTYDTWYSLLLTYDLPSLASQEGQHSYLVCYY